MKQLAKKKLRVFVGMSGGVDSSVAAAILVRAGYEVVGVFIRAWEPDRSFGFTCTWREDRRDAMRVAARLRVPLATLDLSEEYYNHVVTGMIAEYQAGRTPNPDIICNRQIKFGLFYRWATKQGADFVATGHYVRTKKVKTASLLCQAKDKNKDQTYFLWALTQEELQRCLFPIGDYSKPQVRQLARKFGLPNSEKKDSQGLCFIGRIDVKEFLKANLPSIPGKVLNESGSVIGWHEGAFLYTIGERHGFNTSRPAGENRPYYVVAKDVRKNILTVSPMPQESPAAQKEISLREVNWIAGKPPPTKKIYRGRLRYREPLDIVRLIDYLPPPEEKTAVLSFRHRHLAAAGQSAVIYDGEICLGGGVISGAGNPLD